MTMYVIMILNSPVLVEKEAVELSIDRFIASIRLDDKIYYYDPTETYYDPENKRFSNRKYWNFKRNKKTIGNL